MTPLDCDLRGLPWMPLDSVRLLDSDLFARASGDEFKAAVALWCKAWQQVPAASLPDDEKILAHLSGAGPKWKRVREAALRNFILCSDGRLYHPVVAEKALEAWEHRKQQRERAAKRWHGSGTAAAMPRHKSGTTTAMQGTGTGTGQNPKTISDARQGSLDLPIGFEIFWETYPKRAGNNPKDRALKAYRARVKEGQTPAEILDGAGRYAQFCRSTGKEGTEFVLQAATFLGPGKPFLQPWTGPSGMTAPDYTALQKRLEQEERANADV